MGLPQSCSHSLKGSQNQQKLSQGSIVVFIESDVFVIYIFVRSFQQTAMVNVLVCCVFARYVAIKYTLILDVAINSVC